MKPAARLVLILMATVLPLQGCAVLAAGGAVASAGVGVVKTGAKATAAVVRAVIPGD
jgi:hypothetical protein